MEFEARDRWARHHKRTTYEHLPQPEVVAQPSKPTSTLEEKILKRAERPKPQPLAVGYAVPELKWVEWADFRELQRAPEKDSFAIDVLIGHPIIRDYSSRYQIAEVAQDGLQGGNKQQLPGQAPLPERIRIHSRPIRQILKKIHGSDFGPADKAIILIRPFRVLVYYQTQLLAWRDDLASEFPPQTPAESDIKPGNRTEKADGQAEAKSESGANGAGSEKDGAAAPQNENQTEKDGKKGVEESDADTRSPVALQHLQCLLEFMTGHIGMRLSHLESDSCRKITFSDIWHLFKPGDFVIEKEGRQAYRVISVASTGHKVSEPWPIYLERSKPKAEVEQTFIKILCVYIDFDGEHLGPVKKEFTIKMFDEEKPVKSLDIYPFHFSAERNLREELVKRGKIFFDAVVTKHTHKHYAGPTLVTKDEVDSQVVIDFSETLAIADHKDWRPKIEDMIDVTATRLKAKACEAECCRGESVHDDSYVERKRDESFMAGLIPPTWRHSKLPSVAVFRRTFQDLQAGESSNISDDELVIMSYRVFGFVLRSRQWARLDITYLKHVNAQDEEIQRDGKHKGAAPAKEIPALDQLILPGNHKDILVSLISQHFRDKGSKVVDGDQADFVRGKGSRHQSS
ncbi:hypothetical protein RRF57_010433 [Xylaria bambusicola]|uniref:DUF7025 domain-containing protein n=1 Tax=Xylaria bambusicola TaxID=326684 RepID=A0AAN7UL78_9PEZI